MNTIPQIHTFIGIKHLLMRQIPNNRISNDNTINKINHSNDELYNI